MGVSYNSIVISKDQFNTTEDFYKTIQDQIKILLQTDHIMTIRNEDCDIISINYEHDDSIGKTPFGVCQPMWLTPCEIGLIEEERQTRKQICNAKWFDIKPCDYQTYYCPECEFCKSNENILERPKEFEGLCFINE